jgi:hypothetical protein
VVVLLKVIVFATVVAILAVLATLVVLFLLLVSLSLSCTSYSWGTLGVAVLSISPFSIVWFVVEEALVVSFQDKDK